ncbi:hypothetical protein AQJ91_23095 [Streptomyces dysideae]|uniref:Streptomycin biosynthesis protein n=1 Tax=Streptomyces dysideae TaxID=909626 RepID=A0A101UXR3_9ACTN|nr:hypothetical protein AQJ91_23095 [Streptomyces dysideae]
MDGLHRYRAAIIRKQQSIHVQFFDGSEEDAYIYGVQVNVRHGLPLTLAERKAAAERVIRMRPELSNRALAGITGLSAKTVGSIRQRSVEEESQLNARVGLDGRVRPVNIEEGRRLALELICRDPHASVREIARAAGVSVGTAHNLRTRLNSAETTEADRARDSAPHSGTVRPVDVGAEEPAADDETAPTDAAVTPVLAHRTRRGMARREASPDVSPRLFTRLEGLRRDPSLRMTERGRAVLMWLGRRLTTYGEGARELDNLPPHLVPVIADLALECADEWRRLAEELHNRTRQTSREGSSA